MAAEEGKGLESLAGLETSLRETLKKETADSEKRQKAVEIQRQAWDQTRHTMNVPTELANGATDREKKEVQANAVSQTLKAKEEVIEKRKLEVAGKVNAHLTRVTEQARKLDELRRELDSLEDPTKREVADIRKQIEVVDRELKPLKATCERKEKELKDAVQLYNDKSKTKTELVTRLMEIVTESERVRLRKLEDLNGALEVYEQALTT